MKDLELMLCPPGEGVFTIHAAKEKRLTLQKILYESSDEEIIRKSWLKTLKKISTTKLLLLGIPSDAGGGIHRGTNWGPLSIRETNLNTYKNTYLDLGDVRVIPQLLLDDYVNEKTLSSCRNALYGSEKKLLPASPLSIAEVVCDRVWQKNPKAKMLMLGGDHSVSYPVIKSFLSKNKTLKKKTAIIHFDAHTDLLQQRLGIDICFGTWTSHILRFLKSPSHLVQIGIRSSGKPKKHWEKTFGIKQFWSNEIKDQGYPRIAKNIITHLKKEKINSIYVTFDVDVLDASFIGATGTPEDNGLSPWECNQILELIGAEFNIDSADIVEVAPHINYSGNPNERENTLTTVQMIFNSITKLLTK